MKFLAILAVLATLVSPAIAECQLTVTDLKVQAETVHANIVKLSDQDKAKIIETLGKPPQDEPYDMHIIFAPEFARVLIVRDDCIIGFTHDLPLRATRNLLGLEEANY